MKVVIAPDSFKGSLTAVEVAKAIEEGWRRVFPEADIDRVPIADGGEGTVQALVEATQGDLIAANVTGPTGQYVSASFGLLGDKRTAVIEMASASGLTLVPPELRNPLTTTTYGTGELMLKALDMGVRRLVVGIGGSATNDGGAGMAQALGVRLVADDNTDLPWGGAALAKLSKIDVSAIDPRLETTEIIVACDVTNPLCGPQGASVVYGPQKGASTEDVQELDQALANYGRIVERDLGKTVANLPGAGAAGGLGAGLMAFTSAKVVPGIELVLDVVGLKDRICGASLVITGEGAMDAQTVYGKAPVGVARLAAQAGVPVVALAGTLGSGVSDVLGAGINAYASCVPGPMSLTEAMSKGSGMVADAAERVARLIAVGRTVGN